VWKVVETRKTDGKGTGKGWKRAARR